MHRQFAHAPADRIISLVNAAGEPWVSDNELKSELRQIEKQCQTCLEYAKELPRPSVGLPSANRFQDTAALDLKFYCNIILLHIIDHATRYSACARIPSKRPDQVVKALFSHWISIFGPPRKVLSDNGGEFINQELIDLCESLNITLKTTGAEAPWSNGLIERHNQVLANMLDRVLNDTTSNFDIALSWCMNAKNALQNVHGFSPYQLVFGHNPVLPGPFTNNLPALEDVNSRSNEILKENLNALHAARTAFIESERSERLNRALRTNTRTYSDQVVVNGDKVFYKRKDSKRWKGPAFVLGRDGQQVLLKHGGYYIRVHPCRVRLAREESHPVDKEAHDIPAPSCPTAVNTNGESSSSEEETLPNPDAETPGASSTDSTSTAASPATSVVSTESHLPPSRLSDLNQIISSALPSTPTTNVPQLGAYQSTSCPPTCHTPAPPSTPNRQFASPSRLRPRQYSISKDFIRKESNDASTTNKEVSVVNSNNSTANPGVLRKGDKVFVKMKGENQFRSVSLHSRSGKTGSGKKHSLKYKNSWNVQYPNNSIGEINFDKDVTEWTLLEPFVSDTEVLTFLNADTSITESTQIINAKFKELDAWRTHKVYDKVPDENQKCVAVRWVVTPKMIDGVHSVKARLVAKGFQESQDFRKDSPTCSRESIRIALTTIASKHWKLQGIDIQAAFLQGNEIDRVVFLRPPPEANTNLIWKLNKCIYGLCSKGLSQNANCVVEVECQAELP